MFVHAYESVLLYKHGPTHWYIAAFQNHKQVDLGAIRRWCYQTYGVPGIHVDTDEIRWQDNIKFGEVRFSRKEDLEWFVLRWS